MKRLCLILLSLIVFMACKEINMPEVVDVNLEEVATTLTTAVIEGTYEYDMLADAIVLIYGRSKDLMSSENVEMNVDGNSFSITLTELNPNTKYYFKIKFIAPLSSFETEIHDFYTVETGGGDDDGNDNGGDDNGGNDNDGSDNGGNDDPDVPDDTEIPTQTITINGVPFVMMEVEGGTFSMGGSGIGSNLDETPIHNVTLDTYYIAETEVTQKLWYAVMGDNPSNNVGDNKPVDNISWNMAQEFVEILSYLSGNTFRLPTEAEWEYAARGGKHSNNYNYSGSNTVGSVAWYNDNSSYKSHDVKTKIPNELGVYDMSGNVFEWCSDWYGGYMSDSQTNPTGPDSGNNKVVRGGSFSYNEGYCRVSDRFSGTPSWSDVCYGLRIVMEK
ncbi:MAG: formylglycine-generating enzyme family protein [Bacteroidales bacterium]|nr:formylglycine-generating enzyme family protein [Bacteroidales bacterium]